MKVLQVHNFYRKPGGEDVVVRQEAALLGDRGHKVKLWSVTNDDIETFWDQTKDAPGAAGNLATEDLVYFCDRMGYGTGMDLDALFEAARFVSGVLGRALPGRAFGADGRGNKWTDPFTGVR